MFMFFAVAAFPIFSVPIAMFGQKFRLVDYMFNMSKYICQNQIEV